MTVKGASVWHPDGDSTVGALTLDNGTVDFHPLTTTRLTPVFRAVSLTAGSLSGNRRFLMNTDIASHTGDILNVTGNASGNFVLDIKIPVVSLFLQEPRFRWCIPAVVMLHLP